MAEAEIRSPHYVLVIDKKSDEILGTMLQTISIIPGGHTLFNTLCKQHNITDEEIISFVNDMSDKTHAMGWCEDKNCQYKKDV